MQNTTTACPGKNLNANQLEHFINTIFEVLASDERSFEMNYRNITRGSGPKLKELDEESEILLATLAREKGKLKNLTNALSVKASKKAPQTILNEIASLEITVNALEEKIKMIDVKRNRLKTETYDKPTFKKAFTNYIAMVKSFPPEKRKMIYQGLFERITSTVDAKTKNGDITIKVHTDGEIVRKWADMKKFELSEVESSNLRLDVYPREDSNLRPKV